MRFVQLRFSDYFGLPEIKTAGLACKELLKNVIRSDVQLLHFRWLTTVLTG